MSTQSPNIVLAANTAAQYYNYAAAISAALDALGVVQTGDTGQMVLAGQSTLPLPSWFATFNATLNYQHDQMAVNSWSQFQIRKLAATGLPTLYLKIYYDLMFNAASPTSTQVNAYPLIRIDLGSGTDGAGNLTPFQNAAPAFSFMSPYTWNGFAGSASSGSSQPSIVAQQCDFASDGQNYLTIMVGENAPSFENKAIFDFAVERTVDPTTGAYDNAGFCAFNGMGENGLVWGYIDAVNSLQWSGTSAGGIPSIAPPFSINNPTGNVDVFQLIGSTMTPKASPLAAVAYYKANVTTPLTFPVTFFGTAHTYKCCARSNVNADPYGTGTRLALRFE